MVDTYSQPGRWMGEKGFYWSYIGKESVLIYNIANIATTDASWARGYSVRCVKNK
jgi:hypothetical protein